MKTLKRIAALLGMVLGSGAVWLAFSLERVFSNAPGFFRWGTWRDYAFIATLASLGLSVVVVAYCFGFRWSANQSPARDGAAAEPPGSSKSVVGRHR